MLYATQGWIGVIKYPKKIEQYKNVNSNNGIIKLVNCIK